MSNGNNEVYVPHSLASYFLFGNFHTASVANDSFITDTFVLSAMAFKIFYWTENPFAEKAIPFRLIGTVVYGFRLEYLSTGSLQYLLGRRKPNGYFSKGALKLSFSPE